MSERMPDQIFISYSHADRKWLEEFQTMLAPAAGLVDVWSDERLRAGDDWQTQLRIALRCVTATKVRRWSKPGGAC